MKILPLFLAMLTVLSASHSVAGEVTVMSFNLRFGSADDGENAWEHRKDLLVETIKAENPDIIGTQECLDFQAAYIVSQLPDYKWIGLGRQADGTGEMTAIIYRAAILLPVASSHHWLSETADIPGSKSWDSSLPRIVSRVRFYHVTEKAPFTLYNTHFDHRGEVARAESAKLILERIQQEDTPTILTGDFNANGGDSAPWKTLADGGLLDTWDIAGTQVGTANTWNGFETPTADAARRIDWIFVNPGYAVSRCTIIDHHENGRYPSDHFPVIATISLTPAG